MSVKVNYAGVNKRVAACVVDYMVFLFIMDLLFDTYSYRINSTQDSVQDETLVDLMIAVLLYMILYVPLEVLMIVKLGWTPGKLLLGMHIKDISQLKNVALIQIVIRSTLKTLLFVPFLISEWFLILPILTLIPAIFDQHKQIFYDKITKTVVIDYRPKECHLDLNYVGVIRRIIAYVIDHFLIKKISLIFFSFIKITFNTAISKQLAICLFFVISMVLTMVLMIFMIRRFGGTVGQLLCFIHIKDANTLENITLAQAIVRYASFEVVRLTIFITRRFRYISEWWYEFFLDLVLIAIAVIFVSAIFDRRKQFFHDKIAKTVAIDYRPSS